MSHQKLWFRHVNRDRRSVRVTAFVKTKQQITRRHNRVKDPCKDRTVHLSSTSRLRIRDLYLHIRKSTISRAPFIGLLSSTCALPPKAKRAARRGAAAAAALRLVPPCASLMPARRRPLHGCDCVTEHPRLTYHRTASRAHWLGDPSWVPRHAPSGSETSLATSRALGLGHRLLHVDLDRLHLLVRRRLGLPTRGGSSGGLVSSWIQQ